MASKTYELAFAIGAEVSANFAKAFKASSGAINKFNDQLQKLDQEATSLRGLSELSKRTNELHKVFLREKKAMAEAGAELSKLQAPSSKIADYQRRQAAEVEKARVAFEKSNAALKAHARALGLSDAPMAKMIARQKELIRQTDLLTKARSRQEKLQKYSQVFKGNIVYAQQTGEYLKSGFTTAITGGMDFTAQMSRVGAVSGASSEQMKALTVQAKELGKTTVWSSSQVGQGMEFLSMAGFNPSDIQATMPGMLNLASAGGIDLGRAADISSNILTGFGLKAEEMGRVGDVLTNAFTSSNTSLESLGNTMKYAAPVAKSMGVSLEETAAMAGKLGDAGIQGEMAGTTLRAVLLRLSAPSAKAAQALDDLKVRTTDAQGNMRRFPDILADLNKATEKMSESQRAAFIKTIFETEAMSGAMILMEQAGSGALNKYVESLNKKGSAEETARKQNDNLTGDYKALKSALEGVYLTIYEQMEPALRWLTQKGTELITVIEKWISRNPMLSKAIIGVATAFAGIVSSIIPVITVFKTFSLLTSGLGFVSNFLSGGILKLGGAVVSLYKKVSALLPLLRVAAMNPWALGIMAAVTAGYLLYKNWDAIEAKLVSLWTQFREAFPEISKVVIDFCESTIIPAFSGLKQAFSGIIDFIKGTFSGDWTMAWTGLKTTFSGVFDSLTAIAKTPLNAIIAMINMVIKGINSLGSFEVPSWVPKVGGEKFGVNIPEVPFLASGGIATAPSLAMVGEGREPEAILPLSKLSGMIQAPTASSVNVTFSPVINVTGSGGVKEQVQQGLKSGIEDLKRELERLMNAQRRVSYV